MLAWPKRVVVKKEPIVSPYIGDAQVARLCSGLDGMGVRLWDVDAGSSPCEESPKEPFPEWGATGEGADAWRKLRVRLELKSSGSEGTVMICVGAAAGPCSSGFI